MFSPGDAERLPADAIDHFQIVGQHGIGQLALVESVGLHREFGVTDEDAVGVPHHRHYAAMVMFKNMAENYEVAKASHKNNNRLETKHFKTISGRGRRLRKAKYQLFEAKSA